jgi:hypothetical protein
MRPLFVLVVGLGVAGILPAWAVARRSPVVVFLAPLIGAAMAALGAEIELGVGGSIVVGYVVVAVIVNVAVIAWWLAARRAAPRPAPRAAPRPAPRAAPRPAPRAAQEPGRRAAPRPAAPPREPWGWSVLTLVVVLGCLAIPLTALRAPMFGWDANSIWLTHALMVYGGHHDLLTGLQNAAYQFSNPDYPPLVPAAGALAFKFYGLGNLHLAPDMTVLLSACALGVVGTGIAATGTGAATGPDTAAPATPKRRPARIAAVVAAGAICLVGFAVSGYSAVEGYADLLWGAFAVGAVIWGLVLPRGPRALGVAWICAAAASLTKNEGLTTALIIIVLIALRYRPLSLPGPAGRRWAERAAFVVLPALPGLAWAGLIRHIGVHDAFFKSASTETTLTRAGATIAGMAAHLAVAPVALAVLVAGCLFLRRDRENARLGNPAWLWITCLGSLVIIFVTYVIGGLEIHSWLASSVYRTTIFAQVLLYADLSVWLVIAVEGVFAEKGGEPARDSSAGERLPEVADGPGEPFPELDRRLPAQ